MEREGPLNRRLGLAIAVASASVTLAIGVTLGSLLGYIQPPRQLAPLETGGASASVADLNPPDQVPPVLVPVEPAPPAGRRLQAPAPARTRLTSVGTRPRAVRHEDDDGEDED